MGTNCYIYFQVYYRHFDEKHKAELVKTHCQKLEVSRMGFGTVGGSCDIRPKPTIGGLESIGGGFGVAWDRLDIRLGDA